MRKINVRSQVQSLSYTPDSQCVISRNTSFASASVWELRNGKLRQKIQLPLLPNSKTRPGIASITYCQADKLILIAQHPDFSIRIWDWPTTDTSLQQRFELRSRLYRIHPVFNQTRLLTYHDEGEIRFWDVSDGTYGKVTLPENNGSLDVVDISNDGTLIAKKDSYFLKIYSVTDPVSLTIDPEPVHTKPLFGGAYKLRFHPTKNRIAICESGDFRIFDTPSCELINKGLPNVHFGDFEFTPDGKYLLGIGNKLVHVWKADSCEEIACFDFQIGWLSTLAVAPDSLTFAVGSREGYIVTVDLEP